MPAASIVFAFFLVFLLGGCGVLTPAAELQWQDGPVLVWPEPPLTPRVQYLRSLHGPQDFRGDRPSSRVFDWLAGERDQELALVSPYGIAADGAGRVWVADLGVQAVHVIDIARRRVEYLTQAGERPLLSPVGLALDLERKRLYVSDSLARKVYLYDLEGEYLAEWTPPDGFGRPGGLACDSTGRLYVVDVLKARVDVFSPAGEVVATLTSGIGPDRSFNLPTNVAVAADGRIFVCDSMNFRVEVFNSAGASLGTIGSIGDVPGSFARPRGIALDSEGHLYVVDSAFENIQIFASAGELLLDFGGSGVAPGRFSLPSGIFIDRADRIYVADPQNHRIQVFQYLRSSSAPVTQH